MTIVEAARTVTGGIDTHGEVHVAAALDEVGGLLGTESFAADPDGYSALLGWLEAFGDVAKVGVEGTGSYGAGVARFLARAGVEVVEVDRQNRQARRQSGKSDPLDAVEAARAALSGRAHGRPRAETARSRPSGSSSWPSARPEQLASRRSPRCASSPSAPLTSSKAGSRASPSPQFVAAAQGLRPTRSPDLVTAATKAVALLAGPPGRRPRRGDRRPRRHDHPAARETAPELLAVYGVGIDTAAALLVAAGDNPERLRSEAAWAHLCGVSPLEASSGKVTRHRLNRGGDRQANRALWHIVITRLASDPRTQAYMERRVKDGRSKREAIRMLKRYVAREVYRYLPRG